MKTIRFESQEHENFFYSMLKRTGNTDSYHQAFFYCVGISDTTRRNVERIFDFKQGHIRPGGLHEGWQTGGSIRLTRLAFNLWNGYTENRYERLSTPYEIFDCGYAPYFFEAIRLKYPDYCRELPAMKPQTAQREQMETARQTALMEQPEIVELFRVLEGNGLTKEQKEVESLVKYLDGMEVQFGQVLEELRDVKEQLSQIQDGGVKASVLRIAEQAQGKVQEVGGQLNTVRKNLIQSAGNALQTYKEKGKDALRKAVSSMKIPSALARIQEGIHGAVENMNRQADRMKVLNGELHAAGGHLKNAGRIFLGKEQKKVEPQATDKGITAKIRKSFLTISGRLSSMEQTTENLRRRLEQFVQKEEKKPSVKVELKKLKEEKKMVPQLPVPVKQQARE